jgi:hypothetical protein
MKRIFAIVAALSVSSAVFAQVTTPAPTNPNILTTLQQLQLNEAQQTAILQGIQGALTPPTTTGPTILSTPPLSGETTQSMACQIANVGSTPVNISIVMFGHLGEVLTTREVTAFEPHHSVGIAIAGNRSQAWCQFTVDVPASQVRADMVVFTGTNMTTAVPAR